MGKEGKGSHLAAIEQSEGKGGKRENIEVISRAIKGISAKK